MLPTPATKYANVAIDGTTIVVKFIMFIGEEIDWLSEKIYKR